MDYSAKLGAGALACDRVHSYPNFDIPDPQEVPLSSARSTGIYEPVLIKQSSLVIKLPWSVLLEVHGKTVSP